MPLTSSAVSGKRVAPKAPARRRQQVAAVQAIAAIPTVPPSPISTENERTSQPISLPSSQPPLPPHTEETSVAKDSEPARVEQDSTSSTPVLPTKIGPADTIADAPSVSISEEAPQAENAQTTQSDTIRNDDHEHATSPKATQNATRDSEPGCIGEPQASHVQDEQEAAHSDQPESVRNAQLEQNTEEDPGGASEGAHQTQLHDNVTLPTPTKKRGRQRKETTDSTNPQPAKKAKQNSFRSNIAVQASVSENRKDSSSIATAPQNGTPIDDQQPAQSQPKGRKRSSKPSSAQGGVKKRRKAAPSKPSSRRAAGPGGDDSINVQQQQRGDEADDGFNDDPELHEIDPVSLSMFALSHDTVNGKTSEREKKMAAIDWVEVARRRREDAERMVTNEPQAREGEVAASIENADEATENRMGEENRANQGIQFTFDAAGNIVADESSLQINRLEEVEAAERRGDRVEDDNDLTVRINRACWVNHNRRDPADRVPMWKSKSDPWSEDDTDRFYDGLRMFGTDFDIISKMFPGKTRKHVKLKFTREERLDPVRLNNALMGKETRPMNLEHYARETGNDVSIYTKYDGVAHAVAHIAASMKDKQEAMTAAASDEALAAEKQRQEKEKQKAAEKKSTKRTKKSRGVDNGTFGGEPDEGD